MLIKFYYIVLFESMLVLYRNVPICDYIDLLFLIITIFTDGNTDSRHSLKLLVLQF